MNFLLINFIVLNFENTDWLRKRNHDLSIGLGFFTLFLIAIPLTLSIKKTRFSSRGKPNLCHHFDTMQKSYM